MWYKNQKRTQWFKRIMVKFKNQFGPLVSINDDEKFCFLKQFGFRNWSNSTFFQIWVQLIIFWLGLLHIPTLNSNITLIAVHSSVVWREIGVLLATFEAPLRRRVGHDLTTLTLKTVVVVAPVIMIVASQGIWLGFLKFSPKIIYLF